MYKNAEEDEEKEKNTDSKLMGKMSNPRGRLKLSSQRRNLTAAYDTYFNKQRSVVRCTIVKLRGVFILLLFII